MYKTNGIIPLKKGFKRMEYIEKVQRNLHGNIISFQTSQGRIISYQKALIEAENGLLRGITIETGTDGAIHLANAQDGDENFMAYPPIF
jgi:hypothetical protein